MQGAKSASAAVVAGAAVPLIRQWRAPSSRRGKARFASSGVKDAPLQGGLPPYCGRLQTSKLDVLIIGVAHRDDGTSGEAARRMIKDFEPQICLVELDQQRFSRLLAFRQGLPWPYAPLRGANYRPSPQVQAMREVLFSGLELAQSIVGNKDKGGGDEFYEAYLAAAKKGALVVPGDVQISSALDSLLGAIRRGFAEPFGQMAAGGSALGRAFGGIIGRPEWHDPAAEAVGVAVPMALVADGGGRALPLARATAVGIIVANVVSLVMGGNGMKENIEGLQRMDLQGLTDVALALFGLIFSLIVGGAYVVSFLEARDSHMTRRLLETTSLYDNMRRDDGMLGYRWVKSSWAATATPPAADGTQELSDEVFQQALAASVPEGDGTEKTKFLRDLPVRPRPDVKPAAGQWLPLFTVRRPLFEGKVRKFSLFEPRFLRVFDDLKEAGLAKPGLRLAVVYAPHGVERPLGLWQTKASWLPALPAAPLESLPPLAVEVEVVLEPEVRVVEVESITEAVGEDGRRRWRLEARGTSETLATRSCDISADEFGALWLADAEGAREPLAESKAVAPEEEPIKCAAVVGLMHVNSMLERLHEEAVADPAAV